MNTFLVYGVHQRIFDCFTRGPVYLSLHQQDINRAVKQLWVEKGCAVMVRQCAWCLRLIDADGERISSAPLPKLYEATHGMCGICGTLWIEQVLGGQSLQSVLPYITSARSGEAEKTAEPDEPIQTLNNLPLPWS